MKLDRFINRPVLSTVISILIVILGAIGLATLPITQYPDIAPPTVSVRATYTGASASTVLNSVIAPLEEQINGVENMMYMTSTASNTGSGTTFKEVSRDDLCKFPILVVGAKESYRQWAELQNGIADKQFVLQKEIAILTKQRDELLPLLMNGQASVNYHLSHD